MCNAESVHREPSDMELDESAPVPNGESAARSAAPAAESLLSTYMAFGIFDSLTLAKEKVNLRDLLGDLRDDAEMTSDQENEDEAEPAWRELDSIWDGSIKGSPAPPGRLGGNARSGVRRGSGTALGNATVVMVRTKTHDGPSSSGLSGRRGIHAETSNQTIPPAA